MGGSGESVRRVVGWFVFVVGVLGALIITAMWVPVASSYQAQLAEYSSAPADLASFGIWMLARAPALIALPAIMASCGFILRDRASQRWASASAALLAIGAVTLVAQLVPFADVFDLLTPWGGDFFLGLVEESSGNPVADIGRVLAIVAVVAGLVGVAMALSAREWEEAAAETESRANRKMVIGRLIASGGAVAVLGGAALALDLATASWLARAAMVFPALLVLALAGATSLKVPRIWEIAAGAWMGLGCMLAIQRGLGVGFVVLFAWGVLIILVGWVAIAVGGWMAIQGDAEQRGAENWRRDQASSTKAKVHVHTGPLVGDVHAHLRNVHGEDGSSDAHPDAVAHHDALHDQAEVAAERS